MVVFGLVRAVAGFVKVRYLIDKAIIDNLIFRCHYQITSAILFACCIIVTANSLIGHPISCINNDVYEHVINSYCWITSTFTLPGTHGKQVGTEVALSGLGNDNQEKTFHSYYQWVPFMLFFQGILFYVPHWLWKNWEGGKIRMISEGMRGLTPSVAGRVSQQRRLIKYLYDSIRTHNIYSFGYFFCELLNFLNVIGNIFFVDKFLGGAFWTYGIKVLQFSNMDQENRSDPMVEVFPRVTKCTFHKFGTSGTIEKEDALCILAVNILNEKIYIFLWFWFILLAAFSGYAIIDSSMVVMRSTNRKKNMKKMFRTGTLKEIEMLIRKIQVGDFLLLHLLSQNISVSSFSDIMRGLCDRISGKTVDGTVTAPSTLEISPFYLSLLDGNEKGTSKLC